MRSQLTQFSLSSNVCLSVNAESEAMLRCDNWESKARGIGQGREEVVLRFGWVWGWGWGLELEEEAHRCG